MEVYTRVKSTVISVFGDLRVGGSSERGRDGEGGREGGGVSGDGM